MVILDDHPDDPVSNFMDQFYINLHHKDMTVSENIRAIFESHQHIWNNESYRMLVRDALVHIGTNMLLNKRPFAKNAYLCVAQSIVVLEHYNGTGDIDSVMDTLVVRSKWNDLEFGGGSDRRDNLKFFRKRISCKCLKKMHLETRKKEPKMGMCHNCEVEMERDFLSVCGRCKVGQYCSKECQVEAWPEHEEECDDYVSAQKKEMEEQTCGQKTLG